MFVNQQPVPITDGPNTVSIKSKMDFATKNACMDALAAVNQGDDGKAAMSLHFGAYQSSLLAHNIVAWSGPAFSGFACTPENIARLDPDDPLVMRVLEEIAARNPLATGTAEEQAAEKKESTSAGEPPSPASKPDPTSGTPT